MPPAPSLSVVPATVLETQTVLLRGTGWPDCPLRVGLQGKPARIGRIVQGHPVPGGVRPRAGAFAVRIATYGLKPGHHPLTVEGGGAAHAASFEIRPRARPSHADEEGDVGLFHWRNLAAFERRFAHLGCVPASMMQARLASIDRLRQKQAATGRVANPYGLGHVGFFSKPVPGGTNWTPAGPAPFVSGGQGVAPANSGRVISLAIDPSQALVPGQSGRVYAGTANGGIWRSQDGGATWSARTDDQPSAAIGALAIDPNAPNRVFAGTGEYHDGFQAGLFAGAGLLYSNDSGETWTPLAAASFALAAITRILFDPGNTAQHMFLSCDAGVYESTTGGTSWTQLRAGSASDLVLEVVAGGLRLTAGFFAEGLYSSTLSGGVWGPWSAIASPAFPTDIGRIALGQSRNHPQTIWAAFSQQYGDNISAIAKTSTGAAGTWSSVALPDPSLGPVYSLNYNLYVAVHPDTPSTVYLGTDLLFRTTTGNGPWTLLDHGLGSPVNLHRDHHAFAFDATNPQTIVIGNDGGVYASQDGGTNWDQLNHGLGTLQIYQLANHPQWSAMMVAGTQDNGGAFATGAPAWLLDQWGQQPHNGINADVVAIAIDPLAPTIMYYVAYLVLYRSSDGGQTWAQSDTFPGGSEWNIPFILDPANSDVAYAGAGTFGPGTGTLLRSPGMGTNFTAITGGLTGNVTAIAIQPGNSDLLYASTTLGHVYRVQRTGPDWSLANVTTTDLTGAPLPADRYTSCLAVDSAGAVWLSFSTIVYVASADLFTEDHVFFLPPGGTSADWQDRSTGLAQANPVNALAIDPTNDDLVFCGADTSVFRWNAATSAWELWDQGLPNSPIYQLSIHAPSRLMRAATFGRGVWERSIDPIVQPMVDIYMRDNILDDGHGPSPSGVPDPFAPANLLWWWNSVDITVDAPPFQTPAPVTDEIALANNVVHQNPQRGQTNRFYVQLHNRGPLTATNILVRAFFAGAGMGLPDLPADFWTGSKPFLADPSALHWTPIGPAQSPADLEPGHTALVMWEWPVPQSADHHSCLVALATCDEDVLSLPGQFVLAAIVPANNNVVQKNLAVVP